MQSQDVNAARLERRVNMLQVRLGRLLGCEMAKAVDRVECRINLLGKLKVRHIADDRFPRYAASLEALIAVGNRLRIQVEPMDIKARLTQAKHQSPGAAGWFE